MKKVTVNIPWTVLEECYDHVRDEFYEEEYDYLPNNVPYPDTDFVYSMQELGLIDYVTFPFPEFWKEQDKLVMCVVFKTNKKKYIKKAVEDITGQMSDGWGENGIEIRDYWLTPSWKEITHEVEEL